jgi:amidase
LRRDRPAAFSRPGGRRPAAHGFSIEAVQGPMARNVMDTALFLDAMCGYDPIWPLSIEAPSVPFQRAVAEAGPKVRIGFAPIWGASASSIR